MKKVLIISPLFVPINAADMHRVRQSLSFYKENGWHVELVVVDKKYCSLSTDDLLLKSIPEDIFIHKVKAYSENWTRKFGLGSIAYRSFYFYWKYVNELLRLSKFDLIFFSTTSFPITSLGRIWKSKYNIPFIIDMQDPWRSDHYLKLPRDQRPPKFWISYLIDSILEKYVMSKVDGIISVSQQYIDVLKSRYSRIKTIPTDVIPFAAFEEDISIAKNNVIENPFFNKNSIDINIVYIGRAGIDMTIANTIFLKALKLGMEIYSDFKRVKVYYIGTSYDNSNSAIQTVAPIAKQLNITSHVVEITKRIPYYQSLKVLSDSDILFIPGSDNLGYTASKIYAYAWLSKPMITLFHSSSSVNDFMRNTNAGLSLQFDVEDEDELIKRIIDYLYKAINNQLNIKINWNEFEKYTASYQVKKQVNIFNEVLKIYGA